MSVEDGNPPSSPLPLADIRVLDLTSARSGPTCVRQLADWGADVVRIEPAERRAADLGDRHGSDFQNLHRNKRSAVLDLKAEADHTAFLDLARHADVVVENMRPGAKRRLRIAYEDLSALNPRLVYGSISGFGQDGPGADRGGVDQIAQGVGGLMSVTGDTNTGPIRAGVPVTDLTAGLYLAIGILVALHERERTGRGRWVRTSLLEAAVALLDFQATRWTMDGEVPVPQGNHHPTMVPMGCFGTADGHVNIAAWDGRLWRELARIIEREDLPDDPRFDTVESRRSNREELQAIISDRLRRRPTSEWLAELEEAGIPAGPINSVDQVFEDPQVVHLSLVQEVGHDGLPNARILANAVSIEGIPRDIRMAAPELGADTAAVLREATGGTTEPSAMPLGGEAGEGE
jgi:crotonobetainyl-CoA:carnitine CoA-transferase CaiB-like acyl-CoA transferase